MSETAAVVAESKYADDTRALRRDRFYVGMSGFLLFVVVGGFAPTFSLRALFHSTALPLYLHVHGAVLTAWYALTFLQPCLVALGQTHWHRRLGVAAIPVALAVVVVSGVVLSGFAPRHLAEEGPAAIGPIFFGDLAVLVLFASLVSAALLSRRRSETHKRLMMLASILGFWVGDFVNAYVLAKMKIWTSGRWLWTRTIGSTIVGEGVDSFIFYPIAFAGIWQGETLIRTIAFNWCFKVLVEVVLTPVTYAVVGWLKRHEHEDYYDRSTNFTPVSLGD